MERVFRLKLDRLMQANKGFTLIETLFVLFIICMLSTLTMSLHLPHKKINTEIQEITSLLYRSQLISIVNKNTVTVHFSHSGIMISFLDKTEEFLLTDNEYFDEYQMTYNENGHIKTAKTVFLHTLEKTYAFVFQVGSGTFYVQ